MCFCWAALALIILMLCNQCALLAQLIPCVWCPNPCLEGAKPVEAFLLVASCYTLETHSYLLFAPHECHANSVLTRLKSFKCLILGLVKMVPILSFWGANINTYLTFASHGPSTAISTGCGSLKQASVVETAHLHKSLEASVVP